jgi:hypothetical protein
MKVTRQDSLKPYRSAEPQEGSDLIDGARSLFNQLTGEVTRRAMQERAEAQRRGPVARRMYGVCGAAGILAAVTLFYGFLRFPDAPIRETRSGYVSKTGAPHTRQQYEQFRTWEKAVVTTFALTFVIGFAAAAAESMERRKRPGG